MRFRRKLVLTTVYILIIATMDCVLVSGGSFLLEVSPPWLKVGTYVEYEGWDVYFRFLDGRDVGPSEQDFIFRWECIAMHGQVATLNITLYIPPKTVEGSKIIDVKVNTREILDSNGTVLGKACLWLPPYPNAGDKIVVSGKPPNEVTAAVRDSGGSSTHTCQGHQEIYWIHNSTHTKVGNFSYPSMHVSAFMDLDTGLLLHGSIDYTTTVNILGLREMGLLRLLRATNVDLGPRYLRTEILEFINKTLPIWLPTIIFIIVSIIIIRKRRKKRLRKQTKYTS